MSSNFMRTLHESTSDMGAIAYDLRDIAGAMQTLGIGPWRELAAKANALSRMALELDSAYAAHLGEIVAGYDKQFADILTHCVENIK